MFTHTYRFPALHIENRWQIALVISYNYRSVVSKVNVSWSVQTIPCCYRHPTPPPFRLQFSDNSTQKSRLHTIFYVFHCYYSVSFQKNHYRLLYTLTFKAKFIRALWYTLHSQQSNAGFSSPLNLIAKGIQIRKCTLTHTEYGCFQPSSRQKLLIAKRNSFLSRTIHVAKPTAKLNK